MKQLYTALLSVVFGSTALAQGFTISPDDSVHQDITIGQYVTSQIDLPYDGQNSENVVIGWEIVSIETPVGSSWDYSYCDYTNCHAGGVSAATMTPLAPGQTAFFKVNLVADMPGFGMWKVKVFNVNDPASYQVLTYTFNATLGVNDLPKEAVRIFPNPVTDDRLTISNVQGGSNLRITNSLGQIVLNQQISGNSVTLNNLDLRKGVYFVQLSVNNTAYATRKLIVK